MAAIEDRDWLVIGGPKVVVGSHRPTPSARVYDQLLERFGPGTFNGTWRLLPPEAIRSMAERLDLDDPLLRQHEVFAETDQGGALTGDQTALREAAARLAGLRRDLPALRHGAFETLQATETLWVFRRTAPGSDVVVALNTGPAAAVRLGGFAGVDATDALDASAPVVGTGGLAFTVPAGGYRVVTLR